MIKVIIERNIAVGMEDTYRDAIRETLKSVIEAPGYISSESLIDLKKTKHKIIITNWTSIQAWDQWHASPERREVTAKIAAILEEVEKVTVTEPN
jgi:antibiotic biosynthesis monooxygenase (ABM) superfamily enzyme